MERGPCPWFHRLQVASPALHGSPSAGQAARLADGETRCRPTGAASHSEEAPVEANITPARVELPHPRLLACDIDGTILDRHGVLRPRVKEAIAAIAESGVDVVLATGRSPWAGVPELVADLGLRGPHITMHGALISEPVTGEIWRLRALPPVIYRAAIRFADELALDPVVACLDGHRAERLAESIDFIVAPVADPRHFAYIDDLDQLAGELPMRVFLPTRPDRHRLVRLAAQERFGARASIVWSDLHGIEILAPGMTKGDATTWLAAARGVDLAEIAAVGDAMNDVEMLRAAGRSAAMGRAPAEVRAAADIVVPTSDEDGVLDAFAMFFPDLRRSFGRAPRRLRAISAVA